MIYKTFSMEKTKTSENIYVDLFTLFINNYNYETKTHLLCTDSIIADIMQ